MSRTRRIIDGRPPEDVWAAVDHWAESAVDVIALRARWSALAAPTRGSDQFIDVSDRGAAEAALAGSRRGWRQVRPQRRALGRTGELAISLDDDVVAALIDAEVDHRVVTRARRYVWRGPLTGPTYCEISSGLPDGGTLLEAWHEPAWTDGLRPHMAGDDGGERRRPARRVLQARASINRLLAALDVEPIRSA